jgi:hypothetical protein
LFLQFDVVEFIVLVLAHLLVIVPLAECDLELIFVDILLRVEVLAYQLHFETFRVQVNYGLVVLTFRVGLPAVLTDQPIAQQAQVLALGPAVVGALLLTILLAAFNS